jgi:hypothetical protein
MSKGSKRQSWRQIERTHNAITRDLAATVPPKPLVYGCAEPPPMRSWPDRARARKGAEKERLRAIVRAALAQEGTE